MQDDDTERALVIAGRVLRQRDRSRQALEARLAAAGVAAGVAGRALDTLVRAGLVDELLLYQAPMLLGDGARPLFAGLGIEAMAQRRPFDLVDEARFGDDRRLLLRPAPVQDAAGGGAARAGGHTVAGPPASPSTALR